jgi:DNA-binding MarR family transcriptional regulator
VASEAIQQQAAAAAEGLYELDAQIGFILRRAHQRHVAIFADCLSDFALTPQQFSALAKIRETGGVTQNRLGRLTAMDPATILGVVQRLNQRGLIERAPDPTDPRSTRLTLTDAGLDLINEAIPHAMEATERTLSSLSAGQRKELLALLAKLADGEGA